MLQQHTRTTSIWHLYWFSLCFTDLFFTTLGNLAREDFFGRKNPWTIVVGRWLFHLGGVRCFFGCFQISHQGLKFPNLTSERRLWLELSNSSFAIIWSGWHSEGVGRVGFHVLSSNSWPWHQHRFDQVCGLYIYRLSLFEGRIYDDFCSGLAYGIHTGKPSCLVIVLE